MISHCSEKSVHCFELSVSFHLQNIGAPREVSTPWFPNIANQSDLSSSTSSPFSKSSVILPSSCHTIATQQPLMSTTGGANNTHHHHTSLCGASKGGLNLNSISSLSMSMSTTSVNANSGGQMNAATVDGGDGSTQPMFLNVTAPGCTTGRQCPTTIVLSPFLQFKELELYWGADHTFS